MFNDSPILSDFVYPIPYCHSQIDLNSILKIFHRWNCQQIAVFQKSGDWGIIDSVDLLSSIAEVSLNQKLVVSASLRSMPHQTSGLDSYIIIVKPAIIYRSDISLDEFLSGLPKGSLSSDRQKYLLVDCLGELQGKLDTNKILEYLASEYKPNLANRSQPLARSNYCLNLLDSIPLPIKIETTSGKDLYLNTCWQELIGDRHTQQHQLQPDRTIASWWIEQQTKTPDRSNLEKAQSTKNWLSTQKHTSDKEWEDSSMLSSSHSSSELDLNFARSMLGIGQTGDWNYVKIPLTNTNKEYQLVLAIEAGSLPSLPKSIANKLLATVSHELKSPITGIVGLSNLLEAQKLGQLNQRQTRYVKLIHNSGRKIMGIVNDLIQLTSLTTEECYNVELEASDLELLCRQAYQQLLDQLQSLDTSDLEISDRDRLNLDRESNSTAIASKSHLSCILFYLMMQAIEFAKSSERLEVKIDSLSGAIAVTISNTATVSSEPDYDLNSSLPMAIVEYLTEFIQGDLKIERSFNSCQFTLLLPTIQSSRISPQPVTAITTDKTAQRNLTVLCLCPEAEAVSSDGTDCCNSPNFNLKSWLDSKHQANYRHRIIEADGLEQAHTLARIWQLDVIVLAGRLEDPLKYLQSLQTSKYLSSVPLITLDDKTTQAANQIKGLNVYPCLLPAEHRQIEDLMQVIQIAAGV